MTPLEQAISAKETVKMRMPLTHSDNKKIRQDYSSLMPEERQKNTLNIKATLDSMRTHQRFPGAGKATAKNVIFYGAFAIAAGYGNCLEMSCAAAWALNEEGRFNYDLVYYPGLGDHIFAVVGQRADPAGNYPTNFAAWDVNAAICDVWADIACPAQEYAKRWRDRMGNWRVMGITIANLLPTHPAWYDVVDQPKKSYLTPG
jgi:hypothetical protein